MLSRVAGAARPGGRGARLRARWQAAARPSASAPQRRRLVAAALDGVRAARMKAAAARRRDRARRFAEQRQVPARALALGSRIGQRHGRDQRARVRMQRRAHRPAWLADLDDAPEVHDRDAIGDVAHGGDVVRDEQ